MFRIIALLSVITILAISMMGQPPAVTAQDNSPTPTATISPDCKPAALIQTLGTIKSANNAQKDMDALLKLEDAINAQNAACNGLFFKGTGQKSIGPIDLDSGSYLIHLVTKGYFFANLKVISGDCTDSNPLMLFFVSDGQASDGADVTIDSNGCRALITETQVTASWTVAVTKLS